MKGVGFSPFELRLLNEVKLRQVALDNLAFYSKSIFEITPTTCNVKTYYNTTLNKKSKKLLIFILVELTKQ